MSSHLAAILRRIDGRGYRAYKDIAGSHPFAGGTLHVDHVQGDPFAAPSRIRFRVPAATAEIPASLFANRVRRIALEDFLARQVARAIERASRRRGSGKSGSFSIDAGGQEVLERTAVRITGDWVEARMEVGLPAAGRTVLGRQAEEMLCVDLPSVAERALVWENLPQAEARVFVDCVEDQEHLRRQLGERGLVAFVADGAILPRASGVSDLPLEPSRAIPFRSPDALRTSLPLLHPVEGREAIAGMGIPAGVTLIVGGGYHGKSTLLRALERTVYPHVPGDGREYVVTSPGAVKIRAEDGRRVERVDISPFIDRLPFGADTTAFSTEDASGSTSQAANIMEALEAGARVLLLDEDTSATNFMVRDARMQALVHKEDEPITPFVDRVRELYEELGVSTILVMGGSGDYFDVADRVLRMREYAPADVTAAAKEIARRQPSGRAIETGGKLGGTARRAPLRRSFDPSRGSREVKIDAKGRDLVLFGRSPIDLRAVEQIVDPSQTRALGGALHLASLRFIDGDRSLGEVLDELEAVLDREGLDVLDPRHRPERHPGNLARPRRYEIAAAIHRLRTLRIRQLR